IIKQFDIPGAQAEKTFDDAAEELLKLAGDLEAEEEVSRGGEDDNYEGWIDEREMMSEEELEELDACVGPVRLLLTKVSHTAYTIKNSTTLVLPKWISILEDLKQRVRMMPQDVRTRWNSSFDMLDFGVEHCI
ncbi:hypothetical protein BDN72DRAFT_741699, partial [Pluteus cervinus]